MPCNLLTFSWHLVELFYQLDDIAKCTWYIWDVVYSCVCIYIYIDILKYEFLKHMWTCWHMKTTCSFKTYEVSFSKYTLSVLYGGRTSSEPLDEFKWKINSIFYHKSYSESFSEIHSLIKETVLIRIHIPHYWNIECPCISLGHHDRQSLTRGELQIQHG